LILDSVGDVMYCGYRDEFSINSDVLIVSTGRGSHEPDKGLEHRRLRAGGRCESVPSALK
jgi:hypothetical protein